MKIILELTDKQREKLQPLFDQIETANSEGRTAAIGAQIYKDGIVAMVFEDDKGRALSKALGGDFTKGLGSAKDRIKLNV